MVMLMVMSCQIQGPGKSRGNECRDGWMYVPMDVGMYVSILDLRGR